MIRAVDPASFDREVLDVSRDHPVLVAFLLPNAAPSFLVGPFLERLHADDPARFGLVSVDCAAHAAFVEDLGLRGAPTLRLYVRGAVVADRVGFRPGDDLRAWLDAHLPG